MNDTVAGYGDQVVGKTFTVVRTPELNVGDVVVKLINPCRENFGWESPKRIVRINKTKNGLFEITYEGHENEAIMRYAHSFLFGRLI